MSISLEGARGAVNSTATFVFDTVFKGVSKGVSLIGQGVSLTNQAACWGARKVVALGPLMKQTASFTATQIGRLCFSVAGVAKQCFCAMASIAQKSCSASAQFVKGHPKEILLVAGTTAAVLLIQTVYAQIINTRKKETLGA